MLIWTKWLSDIEIVIASHPFSHKSQAFKQNNIKQNEFITQGDANNTKDDVVITKDQIKGKYKKKINGFAKVHKFFTNKHTIIIMVTFAIIVRIGISLLASFVKKR